MPNEPESEQAVAPVQDKSQTKDWFLALLVSVTNESSSFIDVTLTVGGTQISGRLISNQVFFDKLAASVNEAMKEETGDDETDLFGFQKVADDLRSFTAQQREAGQELPVAYIHLDNARVFVPGCQPMPQEGMLWRGRLEAVDGFIIGRLGIS